MTSPTLRIEYETHRGVQELLDRLFYTLEGISIEFDRWEDTYVKGPGLYFAVVGGRSIDEFADPMGENRWPTERCSEIPHEFEEFYDVAKDIALRNDGAVVISVDGVFQEQMVRFRDPTPEEIKTTNVASGGYKDWMGARHMSALDTSKREDVVSTLTLSEETGRVTRFNRGSFLTFKRTELGEGWNPAS